MLHKLKLLGIDLQYLNFISNADHNIQTDIVSINTYQSAPFNMFNLQRGIRQGGVVILVGWGRSFLSVAWPTGVQLMFFFSSGVSKLFGAQGSPSSGSLLNL